MNVPQTTSAPRVPARMRPAPPRTVLLAGLALALTPLAGCGEQNDSDQFAPACAPVGILGEAADYSDYGPADVPDLGRLVAQGSIRGVSGHCSSAANGTKLHTVVRVQLAITRGPAAAGSRLAVPYFVAVLRDGAVLSKQSLVATAEFPDNGDKVALQTDPLVLDLPVSRAHPGTSYRIEVGFQLGEAELAYNRAHPPR